MAVYGVDRFGMPHQAIVFAKKELARDLDVRKVAAPYELREQQGVLGTDAAIWELEIHPTNFCNLKCAGCSYADRHDSTNISVGPLVELLNHYAAHDLRSVFVSGGGDPAYWAGWERVFRQVDCSRFELGVSTNLSNWTQLGRVIDLLAFFQVHVVGFDARSVSRETGIDCFAAIERNLHRLHERANGEKQITLKILVTERNYQDLPRFLDFVARFPCDALVLKIQQNFLVNSREFRQRNLDAVRSAARSHPIGDQFDILKDNLDDELYQDDDVVLTQCLLPASGLYRLVRADGSIFPCVASTYSPHNACAQLRADVSSGERPLISRTSQIDTTSCPLRACRHYRCSLVLDSYIKDVQHLPRVIPSSKDYPALL